MGRCALLDSGKSNLYVAARFDATAYWLAPGTGVHPVRVLFVCGFEWFSAERRADFRLVQESVLSCSGWRLS